MPLKRYKQIKEHRQKIGLANSISLKGRKLSDEHIKNLSKALKGLPSLKKPKGEKSPFWRGGSLAYYHQLARQTVIDFSYSLKKKEVVHHIDGNKKNNNIMNLMVLKNKSQHCQLHFEFILEKRLKALTSNCG